MNIIYVNEFRFAAELSSDELDELGVDCGELDYSNMETRRLLWSVLEEAREYGIDASLSGRVLIEAQAKKSGGVVLYFTMLSADGQEPIARIAPPSEGKQPVMLTTDSLQTVIDACSALPQDMQSSLFEKNGKYRLFCFVPRDKKQSVAGLLGEYGNAKSSFCSVKLASCSETWNNILSSNAVKAVSTLK